MTVQNINGQTGTSGPQGNYATSMAVTGGTTSTIASVSAASVINTGAGYVSIPTTSFPGHQHSIHPGSMGTGLNGTHYVYDQYGQKVYINGQGLQSNQYTGEPRYNFTLNGTYTTLTESELITLLSKMKEIQKLAAEFPAVAQAYEKLQVALKLYRE